MSNTKKGVALKTFRDAGTEKEYEAGKSYDFTEGEHLNFKAAGLVQDPVPASDKKTTTH